MYHHKRGAKVCRNGVLIRQERLDQVLLDAIAEALDERILARAVEKAAARMAQRRKAVPGRRAQLERELTEVETRLQRGLDAILTAPELAEELRAKVRTEKDRKAALLAQLETLNVGRRGQVEQLDERRLRDALRARVRDVRQLLKGDIPRAREVLRKLLPGPLVCTPFDDGARRGYRFSGEGSYREVLPDRILPLTW